MHQNINVSNVTWTALRSECNGVECACARFCVYVCDIFDRCQKCLNTLLVYMYTIYSLYFALRTMYTVHCTLHI